MRQPEAGCLTYRSVASGGELTGESYLFRSAKSSPSASGRGSTTALESAMEVSSDPPSQCSVSFGRREDNERCPSMIIGCGVELVSNISTVHQQGTSTTPRLRGDQRRACLIRSAFSTYSAARVATPGGGQGPAGRDQRLDAPLHGFAGLQVVPAIR
jgi:hypothetical protein